MQRRIVIIGPSGSGKSTLAQKLGRALGLPVLHLDQIAHRPGTKWQRVEAAAFAAAHDAFLAAHDGWVIEGNYQVLMPQRLAAADTVIWCDPPLLGCTWRYLRRSLRGRDDRAGGLAGAGRDFSWQLLRYTWVQYPRNRLIYARLLAENPHLSVVKLGNFSAIKACSSAEI